MPGAVDTDILTSNRNRQERFQEQMTADQHTPESLDGWTNFIASGLTIEESASVLFDGIQQDQLYIGFKGFAKQRDYGEELQYRMNNIINETNPEVS